MWESRLVSESITHHPNMTSPLGDSLCLAPTIYWKGTPRTFEVNGAQHRTTEPMRLADWCPVQQETSSYGSLSCSGLYDISGLATFHLIPSHWRSLYTVFFHLWPLPLCTMGISSPPWYDDSVSLASPHVSRIPGGTLHGQEDESWQHNAVVKDDGWAGGLTECSAAPKRWMFSRPDMACYHYWLWKMSRSRIVQSTEDIHVRCEVSKICYWRIWQSISRNQ